MREVRVEYDGGPAVRTGELLAVNVRVAGRPALLVVPSETAQSSSAMSHAAAKATTAVVGEAIMFKVGEARASVGAVAPDDSTQKVVKRAEEPKEADATPVATPGETADKGTDHAGAGQGSEAGEPAPMDDEDEIT